MDGGKTFATFYVDIVLKSHASSAHEVFHFFKRDWIYTCHGTQAEFIAKMVYKTTNVLRMDAGLPTVEINSKLFNRIVEYLFAKNIRIVIWKRDTYGTHINSSSNVKWHCGSMISAAHRVHIETELGPINSSDDTISPHLVAIHACLQSYRVGVALVSTSHGTFTVYEFVDEENWNNLENLLMQLAALACVVTLENDQGEEREKEDSRTNATTLSTENNNSSDRKRSNNSSSNSSSSSSSGVDGSDSGISWATSDSHKQLSRVLERSTKDFEWTTQRTVTATIPQSMLISRHHQKQGTHFAAKHQGKGGVRGVGDLKIAVLTRLRDLNEQTNSRNSSSNNLNSYGDGDVVSADGCDDEGPLFVDLLEHSTFGVISTRKMGICAAATAMCHLGLWEDSSVNRSYRITAGELQSFLSYDGRVAAALSIFPENSKSSSINSDSSTHVGSTGVEFDTAGVSLTDTTQSGVGSAAAAAGEEDADDYIDNADPNDEESYPANHPLYTDEINSRISYNGRSTEKQCLASASPSSILQLINFTCTKMGSRLLRHWLQQPLADERAIINRQDKIEAISKNLRLMSSLREQQDALSGFPDLERLGRKLLQIPQKVTLQDLLLIYRCMLRMKRIHAILSENQDETGAAITISTTIIPHLDNKSTNNNKSSSSSSSMSSSGNCLGSKRASGIEDTSALKRDRTSRDIKEEASLTVPFYSSPRSKATNNSIVTIDLCSSEDDEDKNEQQSLSSDNDRKQQNEGEGKGKGQEKEKKEDEDENEDEDNGPQKRQKRQCTNKDGFKSPARGPATITETERNTCEISPPPPPPLSSSSSSFVAPTTLADALLNTIVKFKSFQAMMENLIDTNAALGITSTSTSTTSTGSSTTGGAGSQYHSPTFLVRESWMRIRSDIHPSLTVAHRELKIAERDLLEEYHMLLSALSDPAAKVLHMERSSTHGMHLRVTQKETARVFKKLQELSSSSSSSKSKSKSKAGPSSTGSNSYCEVLSKQKAGTLFVTQRIKSLIFQFNRAYELHRATQADILLQAVRFTTKALWPTLRTAGALISELDGLCSLAYAGWKYDWVRPVMTAAGEKDLHIEGLRHPLLEAKLGSNRCVRNRVQFSRSSNNSSSSSSSSSYSKTAEESGISLDKNQVQNQMETRRKSEEVTESGKEQQQQQQQESRRYVGIITGPNLGGKSTYLRAVGIAVLLAHLGCNIPAEVDKRHGSPPRVPVVDRIFTRVGSVDCQLRGVSTFMSEMLDVSYILRKASPRSLVLMDELGRGTSTHDGYGVAWATLHTLAEKNKCMALFATHLHEVTEMEKDSKHVFNAHAAADVSLETCKVTMRYQILPGPSNTSYGIQVAKMVNFPAEIIQDAEKIEAIFLAQQQQEEH